MQVVREHEPRQHQDEAEQERGDVFADGPVHGGLLFHLHLSVNTKNYWPNSFPRDPSSKDLLAII